MRFLVSFPCQVSIRLIAVHNVGKKLENYLLLTFIFTIGGEEKAGHLITLKWSPSTCKPQFTKIRLLDSILLPQSWVWANSLGPPDICRKHIIQKNFWYAFLKCWRLGKSLRSYNSVYFSWYMYNGYNLYVGERREMKWMKTSLCQQLESVEREAKS